MSEYIITDEQLQKDHEQFYEAGQRNRQVWTARVYHGREIVRCRDCEHYYEADNYHPQGNYTSHCCKYFDSYNDEVEPDGFCAWGERRGE